MKDITLGLQYAILGVIICLGLLILVISVLLAEARYRRRRKIEEMIKRREEVKEEMRNKWK